MIPCHAIGKESWLLCTSEKATATARVESIHVVWSERVRPRGCGCVEAWDDDFREPNEDERTARRVLSLAIAFINAHRPLTMVEIHREFYPDMSDASFRKAFLRDRERLVIAGLCLRQGPRVDDFSTWEVDADSSFVRDNELTEQDALTLDVLLLPLASDPSFPYARDLRLALTKIDRSFDGYSNASIPPEARKRNNQISLLEDCMTAEHMARISYTRADGTTLERTIAPLGFFFLNESTYMVAAEGGPHADGLGEAHTYNLDRVSRVNPQRKQRFERPRDFDVRDYILLPFQMGPDRYIAQFRMGDGSVREEGVFDEQMAASWAIAQSARPLSPDSLVNAWRQLLQNAAKGLTNE